MFLHLGNDISVRAKDVIAVHDYKIFRDGVNREYLEEHRSRNRVIDAANAGQPRKSLVVAGGYLYVSAISPLTLKRRTSLATDDSDLER